MGSDPGPCGFEMFSFDPRGNLPQGRQYLLSGKPIGSPDVTVVLATYCRDVSKRSFKTNDRYPSKNTRKTNLTPDPPAGTVVPASSWSNPFLTSSRHGEFIGADHVPQTRSGGASRRSGRGNRRHYPRLNGPLRLPRARVRAGPPSVPDRSAD